MQKRPSAGKLTHHSTRHGPDDRHRRGADALAQWLDCRQNEGQGSSAVERRQQHI